MKKWFASVCLVLVTGLVVFAQEATVTVLESDELNEILVDSEGYTLYAFTQDQEGVSFCYYACLEEWPPFLTQGDPAAEEQLDGSLLSTAERSDGSLQVTFNGHPLYHFSQDEIPNETSGQGVTAFGGTWYVVSPDGELKGVETASIQRDEDFQNLMAAGEGVFSSRCSVCHLGGVGPVLAGNEELADQEYVIFTILNGRASGAMPSFRDILSNEEIAEVATFVRNNWGNEFGPITPEQVQSIRGH